MSAPAMGDEALAAALAAFKPVAAPAANDDGASLLERELRVERVEALIRSLHAPREQLPDWARLRVEAAMRILTERSEDDPAGEIREVAAELQGMADEASEYVGKYPNRGYRGQRELESLAVRLEALLP